MKVITFCDHKGGVGKSTTASAIAQGIEKLHPKAKTLLIDADPQGSATLSIYGVKDAKYGLYEVIKKTVKTSEAIIHTEAGDIIPYSRNLISLDSELANDPGRNFYLKEAIEQLEGQYTHVIIDTSPYLNLANVQSLTASTSVVIPIGSTPEAVESLPTTLETILSVKKYLNNDLEILGALITLYDGRSNVVKQYGELLTSMCKKLNIKLLKTRVRTCAVIHEAHALKTNLFKHAPRSNAVKDYTDVIKELKL